MFRWAQQRKQLDRSVDSHKTCQNTSTNTYISGSSNQSTPSRGPNTPDKRLKAATPSKKRALPRTAQPGKGVPDSIGKSELMQLVVLKQQKHRGTGPSALSYGKIQYQNVGVLPKKIQVRIQVNNLLDEFCAALSELSPLDYGIYVMGSVLLRMGFVTDLVKQRDRVQQLWQGLGCPDPLSLYCLVEVVSGNRVNIDTVLDRIQWSSKSKQAYLNGQAARWVLAQKPCSHLYEILRVNRLQRQRCQQGAPL